MVTLSTNGASIIFDFEDSQHYLYGTGQIIAPLNSLSLVVEDDGKSITFKKGASNDIFVSVPIDEIDGMDADALVTWWEANAVGTPVADGIQFKVVNALPTVGSPKFIYLLQSPEGWSEWAYQQGEWISFGTLQTIGYEGKDAIKIAKSATTASAYTVSLKIADDDKFLHQTSGGVRDYANLRTSADTSGHQHIVLSGYDAGEISNIQLDDYTGLSAISANNITDEISLIIDPASNTAITQSNAGLKLTAENNIKTASSSTRPPETREVFKRFDDLEIQSAQTVSSTTYQLYSLDEPKDVKIEVVNDKYTSAVTIDNDHQQILLDVVQPDKTVKVLSGNMEEVIFEDDAKDGLEIDSHLLKVKIDPASNSGLTVSIDGVKSAVETDVKVASASTRPLETKEIFKRFNELEIKSGQTASSTTYQLYSLDEAKDVVISVPNEQYVSAVSIDNNNQQVLLDLKKADGSVEVLSGNMENVIFESDLSDGLTAVSHSAKVKIDDASNSGLTVSAAGVKLDAENNVKTASASTRPVQTDEVFRRFNTLEIESARTDNADTYQLKSLDELKDDLIEVKDTFHIVSALPASGDVEILYILETTNPETSAKTYTQYIWKDNEWKQTSSNATGGNTYSAGTNIDIYKALPTDDFYTISGSQVVDLTQQEYDALAVKNPDKIYNITDALPYILSAYTNIEIASALTEDNQTVHRISAKDYEVVSALPAVADATENTIYLLKVGTAPDVWYDEYAKIDGAWEKLSVDLSDFIISAGEY